MDACMAMLPLAIMLCSSSSFAAQQCISMLDKPYFAPCTAAGYNTTYPVPSYVTSNILHSVKHYHEWLIWKARNCSVAQIAEAVGCTSFAPYCKEGRAGPLLPCRRVCIELLNRCEGTLPEWFIDRFISQCALMPNDTAVSGKCYEPPQFTDLHVNKTAKGPYDRPCQTLVNFPFCEDLGYEYTIATARGQALTYSAFYGKNITIGDRKVPAPGSVVHATLLLIGNYSKCADGIRKELCGAIMPPCFPGEEKAFYTVCQNVCKSVGENCPGALNTPEGMYLLDCERYPDDLTSHGFCKHTKWPPQEFWREYIPPTSTSKPQTNTTAIVAGVLVPLVVIVMALTVAIVVLWKRNKLTAMFSYKRYQDDKKETESPPDGN